MRFFLKRFSDKCKKDKKSRIEVALELYVGARQTACFGCSHIARPIIERAITHGGKSFGVDQSKLKEKFENVYWRRGLANVLKGIAQFGVKKPFTPGAPFLVVWNYTQICNLRCKHCYASAGTSRTDELTSQEALDVVRKLGDAGVTIIAFSGGEPLMRKDIFDTVKAAHDYGIFTAIATNATLINKDIAKKLKDADIGYVQISLDGAKPETHDNFRGVPNAYEGAIRGIKNCVEQDIFVEVATTATKWNYKEVPEIIDLCEQLGVDWWMMYNFVPTGRGKFILGNDLSPQEREEVLQTLWNKLRAKPSLQILATAPQYARVALEMEEKTRKITDGSNQGPIIVPTHFYNPHLHGQLLNLSDFIGGCGAGRFYCAVDYNGDITPCVFFPLKVGDIKKDNFEELWTNNKIFLDLRDRSKLKRQCSICKYKFVCGGCRARAYGYFGDYNAPDPGCINNKSEWTKLLCEVEPPQTSNSK